MVFVRATYRLQLHAGFPLSRARALVPYLSRLGVSHIHCSPLLQARRGSTHGYDVVDPTRLDPALGTEDELELLHQDLARHGMGLILDIVPNHMAASSENLAWEDVLAHGAASRYSRWFDIDWRATERELRSRVLLPVLGDQLTNVLERGEISLISTQGIPRVRYFEHEFPLDPATIAPLLRPALVECERQYGEGFHACRTLRESMVQLRKLPRRGVRDRQAITRRLNGASDALGRIRDLVSRMPDTAGMLARATEQYAQSEAGPARLRRLLDAQVYRLVHWRRAAREINYRRFFDVNDLIALHMEDPEVFAQTHALPLEWRRRGWVDGFRIDHPDGLLDPLGYLERLAKASSSDASAEPTPIYVEKILSPGEQLRESWPVSGTTGYDFLNQTESLFLEPHGFDAIEREYRRLLRRPLDFGSIAREGKRLVLESGLSAGVRRLADRLLKLAGPGRPLPAVRRPLLAVALVETIVALRVYRTYVDERCPVAEGEDRRLLEEALSDARSRGRAAAEALNLLEAVLLGHQGWTELSEISRFRLRCVQRFQQVSGPATAKGIEDTAFYAYAPLLSRNEVGGGPETPLSRAVEDFHRANAHRAERWPGTMVALTTHDTKRSADARARLDVLTELPEEWARRIELWRGMSHGYGSMVRGRRVPDVNTWYHVLQAILAVWPLRRLEVGELDELRARLSGYALKAAREAKVHTSWTEPDQAFEAGLSTALDGLLSPARSPRFLDDLDRLVRWVGRAGLWNSLARTVFQLTAPGVPDLYQGDELWNFSLVDPDNRRPVDFDQRVRLLEEVEHGFAQEPVARRAFLDELVKRAEDGRLKLHTIVRLLGIREKWPDLFLKGSYLPLRASGPAADAAVGFAREAGPRRAVVLVPRLLASRITPETPGYGESLWQGTALSLPAGWPARWTCGLTGTSLDTTAQGTIRLTDAFRILPAACLLSAPDT
jgi:(1->4)-alpha-D-glucan 1-alpha-D-glucosylmutase